MYGLVVVVVVAAAAVVVIWQTRVRSEYLSDMLLWADLEAVNESLVVCGALSCQQVEQVATFVFTRPRSFQPTHLEPTHTSYGYGP